MKKYKLIKTYPGSPPLETIGERYQNLSIKFINIKGEIWHSSEHPELIENHPEYWEEIVEKEYEILSILLRRSDKHELRIVNKDDSHDYIMSLINCDGNSIHSVKRLSDGEIFTVGDKIKGFVEDNNPFTITNIFMSDIFKKDEIVLTNYPKNTSPKNGRSAYLSTIIKAKQPLFTTEDGVDVYENDKIYILVIDADTGLITGDISSSTANEDYGGSRYVTVQQRSFSTKEAAEKHILFNKPCLSINDILNLRDGLMFIEKELKELVKSKLK